MRLCPDGQDGAGLRFGVRRPMSGGPGKRAWVDLNGRCSHTVAGFAPEPLSAKTSQLEPFPGLLYCWLQKALPI